MNADQKNRRRSACISVYIVEIDPELKTALQELLDACREFQITPRLIGGLAVRGYTHRK